ncbi:MAG: transcription elongation factor GreA [Chloroflexi bacterium]|nr:transcription elongation factor GreA [Chloroflexota bacterium]
MPEKQVYLTREGLARLQAELDHLRTARRPQVAEDLRRAKEAGGTVNNAEYEDAKNEQAFVEGRILELERLLKDVHVVEHPAGGDRVDLGSVVTVKRPDGKTEEYELVGSVEADPAKGKISNASPVGQALLGRKVGEGVEIIAPGGIVKLIITRIK